MAQRRKGLERAGVFDTSKTDLEEFTDAIYGASEPGLETGRIVARPTPLEEIYADVRQPRRAIPYSVRLNWDGSAQRVPDLLKQWGAVAGVDARPLIEGSGDGIETDGMPPVALQYVELARLAGDIKRVGLSNPISVVRYGNHYMIESGERRFLAYYMIYLHTGDERWQKIPAILSDGKDFVWRQASENTARRALNAIGMARQLALLIMESREGIDGVKYDAYEQIVLPGESDRRFYAQVANGNIHRIPKGFGERIQQAMGLSEKRIAEYRRLLKLTDDDTVNDALWVRADVDDWAERFMRDVADTLPMGKVREIIERPNWTSDDLRALIERPAPVAVAAPTSPIGEVKEPVKQEVIITDPWPMGTAVQPLEGREAAWIWRKNAHGVYEPVYRAAYRPGDRWLFEHTIRTGDGDVLAALRTETGSQFYITRDLLQRANAAPVAPPPAPATDSGWREGRHVWVQMGNERKFGVIRYLKAQPSGEMGYGVYKFDGGSTHYYTKAALELFTGSMAEAADLIRAAEGGVQAPQNAPAGSTLKKVPMTSMPDGWFEGMRVLTKRRAQIWEEALGGFGRSHFPNDVPLSYQGHYTDGATVLVKCEDNHGYVGYVLEEAVRPLFDRNVPSAASATTSDNPYSAVQKATAEVREPAPQTQDDDGIPVLDPTSPLWIALNHLQTVAGVMGLNDLAQEINRVLDMTQGDASLMSAEGTLEGWINALDTGMGELQERLANEVGEFLSWLNNTF